MQPCPPFQWQQPSASVHQEPESQAGLAEAELQGPGTFVSIEKEGGEAQKAILSSRKEKARRRKSPLNAANNHNGNIHTALPMMGTIQSG